MSIINLPPLLFTIRFVIPPPAFPPPRSVRLPRQIRKPVRRYLWRKT